MARRHSPDELHDADGCAQHRAGAELFERLQNLENEADIRWLGAY